MRLGIVVSHPIQYYAPLFRELARRMDVHVFYGQFASPQQQAAAGFGVSFDWDVDLTSGYPSSILENCATVPSVNTFTGCDVPTIRYELEQKALDAVLVTGWYQKVFLQAVWAAKRLGLPVLVRGDSQLGMPSNSVKRVAKKAIYPFLLRAFDTALYVGQDSRAYYLHFGYPKDRLFFSPHCIDTKWFAARSGPAEREKSRNELGVEDETKLVLFAGKLVEFKRPLDVIRATARLRLEGLKAEVMSAGAGALAERMEAEAKMLGVPLHALGFCNQTTMPSVYAAADVLALPSTGRETWGLVCNEALACGSPIVVSDQVGCAPDLAGDDYVGRQFPVGDTAQLAAKLGRTLSHPPSAAEIGALSDKYSIARATDGIEAAMQKICGRENGIVSTTRPHTDQGLGRRS